jgi:hypothetical protein
VALPPGFPEGKAEIWIYMATSGLSFSGDSKGYLYSLAPGYEVVPDTDHPPGPPLTTRDKGTRTWIRHVEGPWHVFFEVTN